jgi:carboxyl-terminal processing protease
MYSDFESFNKRMIPENVPFNQLIDLAATFGIVPREEELEISGKHIRLQIKALIAARLYGTGSFYRVINPVLPEYKKALEVMNGLL